MPAVINGPDVAPAIDMNAVGPREQPLAHRTEILSAFVENQHRMRSAMEDVDVFIGIDRDAGRLVGVPPGGQAWPVGYNIEGELLPMGIGKRGEGTTKPNQD